MALFGWDSEIVSWTGDSASSRQIPTSFSLAVGSRSVMVLSKSNAFPPAYRHAGPSVSMPTTAVSGIPGGITNGITGFNATGFTVDSHLSTNRLNQQYIAIVLRDTSVDNAFMRLGSYVGDSTTDRQITVGWRSTNIWVWGKYTVYTSLPQGAFCLDSRVVVIADLIKAITATGFLIGSGVDVNQGAIPFYWMALRFSATDLLEHFFTTIDFVATSDAIDVVSTDYTAGFALAFRGIEASSKEAEWRGPTHAGTGSTRWQSGFVNTAGGVEAFNSVSVSIGEDLAPNATRVLGWAWKSSYRGAAPAESWWTLPAVNYPTYSVPVNQYIYTAVPPTVALPGGGTGTFVVATEPNPVGWWSSSEGMAGEATITESGVPENPRSFAEIVAFATGNAGALGGSPSASAVFNNQLIYPIGGYVVGTTAPSIHVFDGLSSRHLVSIPTTTAGVIPKAILSMIVANGVIYVSTLDSGTTAADFAGRVFQLDPISATLTQLGADFTGGHVPYALAWHAGRLWVGTNKGSAAAGKVYFFRPDIDTVWTDDYTLSSSTAGGVTSMLSYRGLLMVGTDNAAASYGKVLARATDGTYSTLITASGGTARVNNGHYSMYEFKDNLYVGYWNEDTTAVALVRKYDGTTWSVAYTGATTTLRPYIGMFVENGFLYVIGGGRFLDASLIRTDDGASWTNLTVYLSDEATATSVFGVLVL